MYRVPRVRLAAAIIAATMGVGCNSRLGGLTAQDIESVTISNPMVGMEIDVKPGVGVRDGKTLRITEAQAIRRLLNDSLYTDPPPTYATTGLNDFVVTFVPKPSKAEGKSVTIFAANGTSPGFFRVLNDLTTKDSVKY